MDIMEEVSDNLNKKQQQPSCNKSGRPPPIVLTSTTNLMQLQRKNKGIVMGSSEFRNTRNGTRMVTKEMADFSAIKKFLESNSLAYFSY
jgi:hypothetical protein